ncbi:DUF2267 domain-containing protein [bacterium]|nr:DUF2267 domain-containing protein [bacterium]
MSVKSIGNFEHALHVANEWIKELSDRPEIGTEHQAYVVLRVVLHTIRDRLRVDEVAHLSAQLPMLVRGFFFDGWKPPGEDPTANESTRDLLQDVGGRLDRLTEIEPEDALFLVYELMFRKLSPGEMKYVDRALPYDLLFPWWARLGIR